MATLIPGYDFSITEEVTASKLMKWLLGCTLDGTIGYASAEIGTGFSLSGMTNEGDLEVNFSTGKVNVRTRWGMVPVMGGGMFTKRCAMYHNDPDPSGWNQSAFFDCYYKLGPHGNRATTFSLADPSSMGPGIGPDNAYCYASNIYSDSGYNTIASWMSPWPSAELEDPTNYDVTMPTCSTSIHPTLCLQGFSPIYATISTAYSGARSGGLGAPTYARTFRSSTGNSDQYRLGIAGFWAVAANFTVASSGTTWLHWGYLMPTVGPVSSNSVLKSMNNRV